MGVQHSQQNRKMNDPLKFLLRGLHNAGKTSVLYKMKQERDIDAIVPTIGADFQTFSYQGLKINGWDYSVGREHFRPIVQPHIKGCSGIIYVIDSADIGNIGTAMDELYHTIIVNESTQKAVIMVLANKQDLDGALSAQQIENRLKEMNNLGYGITLFVMSCSAITGEGVQLALNYFFMQVMLKQKGKLKSGFISQTWESANDELEKNMKSGDGIANQ